MSYEKQNFVSGQILKADHLNYMEDGIVAALASSSGLSDIEKSLIQVVHQYWHMAVRLSSDCF